MKCKVGIKLYKSFKYIKIMCIRILLFNSFLNLSKMNEFWKAFGIRNNEL